MKRSTLFILLLFAFYSVLGNKTDLKKINFGFWAQVWYQHVEKGKNGNSLNDFMVRRAYLSIKGQPTDYLGFFAHIAVDRLGQDGLDNPGLGLGSGLAFRDL